MAYDVQVYRATVDPADVAKTLEIPAWGDRAGVGGMSIVGARGPGPGR